MRSDSDRGLAIILLSIMDTPMNTLTPWLHLTYLSLVCAYLQAYCFACELQEAIYAAKDDLTFHLTNGKASRQLILELALHYCGQGSQYEPKRIYNVHAIYDALKSLEAGNVNGQNTKSSSSFRHKPLKGLYHKHHFQACYIPNNVLLELNKGNTFKKLWDEVANETNIAYGDLITQEFVARLSHKVTFDSLGLRRQRQALTGEWIVYASIDGQNYYLTLASHNEDDADIYKRVQLCFSDFPELEPYLESIA
jgi:hypothetical protein